MRRLVPWLLLGVLGLITGLGLGLGVAFEGSGAGSVGGVQEATLDLVPSWLPPGFEPATSGSTFFGFDQATSPGVHPRICLPSNDASRWYSAPPLITASGPVLRSVSYVTARCSLAVSTMSSRATVNGRNVAIEYQAHRITWAAWQAAPDSYVLAVCNGLSRTEFLHFIAGLRVAHPSYPHHH